MNLNKYISYHNGMQLTKYKVVLGGVFSTHTVKPLYKPRLIGNKLVTQMKLSGAAPTTSLFST